MREAREVQTANWAALVLRIVVGVVFVAHGGRKLFTSGLDGTAEFMEQTGIPLPYISAIAATFTELLGGLALIVGLSTRIAAIPLAFTMLVAAVTVHRDSFFLPQGFEYTLVLFVACVALVLQGSGALSIDFVLKSRRKRSGDA